MKLKGSRTEKNLQAAFAGESQAHNKYTYFADVAKEEGFKQIARIFLEAAENERKHAEREFDFLNGIKDTEANLKAAAEGEHHEWTKMYAEFERVAREEGFTEIADFFKRVTEIEKQHERRFLTLLKDLQEGEVFKKDEKAMWKCRHCGWIQEMVQPSNECPTCKSPKSGFEIANEVFPGY